MKKEHDLGKSENFGGEIRVLNVGESPEYLDKCKDKLEATIDNIDVKKATDVESCLDIVDSEDVDLILSNFQLEGGNAMQLLEEIRSKDQETPFMLLIPEEKKDLKDKAILKGAEDCFLKEDIENNHEVLARRIENAALSARLRRSRKTNQKEFNEYKKFVESASELMLAVDTDLQIVKANQAMEEFTSLEPEEIEGEDIDVLEKEFIPQNRFEEVYEELERLIEREDEESSTLKIEAKVDSPSRRIELDFKKFYDDAGDLVGLTITGDKITPSEEKRSSSQERLNEFSSLVSHDLRNPLNLAQGYLDLARETEDKEDYQVIEKAHNRMERIIDELLIITSQEDEINKEEFRLETTFEEAYYFAGEENSSYSVEDDTKIYGDRTGAISMFENLISNSIHHNEGPVEIRVGTTEDGFYYEDTGSGIDEDERDKVFEYGYSSSEEGRGLGLAIVKRIAEVNNWKLELGESEEGGMRLEFKTNK